MEDFDAIMAMWNLMGVFLISNAMYFAACAFLIWVGFRFTNNIYNNPDTMLIGKVLTTLFCISVAMFTFGNMAQFSELLSDIAGSFAAFTRASACSSNLGSYVCPLDVQANIQF